MLSIQSLFAKNAIDAEAIFAKSIKLFSLPNISFRVDSEIKYQHSEEQRSFFLAKQTTGLNEYSLLIRFISPTDIKCTAVLVKNKQKRVNRYAYFPSLNRVRIIPSKDENKEVFGIGISYEELSHKKGEFISASTLKKDHKLFYKLVLLYKNIRTDYYINQKNNLLENIDVFKNEKLIKKISILNTMDFKGNKIISSWKVDDIEHQKHINFKIDEESVTDQINKSLFFKNRLDRCLLKAS